jgi:molybdenum cofactor biosynthesis enzyme MoaA
MAKSCLFSNRIIDLKPALKQGKNALCEALFKVISNKTGPHNFEGEDGVVYMSSFGG